MRMFSKLAPAYRGTGGRVTFIRHDWRELHVTVPLSLRTRNYVGTIYGGSLYGAVDPWYMLMLMHCLGREYVVWDKAASIRFRRPGRETLYAKFLLEESDLDEIRQALSWERSIDREYQVQLVNAGGIVHAEIDKLLYISTKEQYIRR